MPQEAEWAGTALPRGILDWLELHAWPQVTSPQELNHALDFWRSRKVALVKQTSYWAMYEPAAAGSKWQDVVLGNQGHLGPMSFLADLGADYLVVHQEPEPECYLWKLKYIHCPDPESRFRRRLQEMDEWLATNPAKPVVRCDDVAWDRYDLVICMDIPIPDRIVQKCRKTCWAYFSTEPGSPLQKEALRKPREGYQLFLNHGFRRYRCRPWNRSHVVEFPYSFQSQSSWDVLSSQFGSSPKPRRGVLVEKGSWQDPLPPSPLPCTRLQGTLREYLQQMFSCRYAVRTDPKPRWGNWGVEAVLAGNIFLGRASSLDHRATLLPTLDCPDLETCLKRAEEMEATSQWESWHGWQRRMVENLSFQRPLVELTRKALQRAQS